MFFPTTLHEAQALADRLARDNPSYELTVDGDHQLIRVTQRERRLGQGEVTTTLATTPWR